ncbi:hypothetical protein BFP70_07025 [Thioclava sp. SK-1]|nr:hypothetical protein BFP70_07025 [Thioclava sp. SK-1]
MSGLAALSLSACGPVTVAQAERICAQRMVNTSPIRGEALMGINQDGKVIHDIDMNVSLSTRMGYDSNALYTRCVYDRSGEFPTQPLYSRQN